MKPEILAVYCILQALSARADLGYTPTVTSANDSAHVPDSRHYMDLAIDIRTHDMRPCVKEVYIKTLNTSLSSDYQVIVESDHIHVQYHPKAQLEAKKT